MKLTFRGHSYNIPTPIRLGSAATDQSKIKLTYRGHTYDYTPCPVTVSKAVETDKLTVRLIYRGNAYERQLQSQNPYQKPRAINWRYQHGEG